MKKIGINYGFLILTILIVIGLPLFVGVSKFNYFVYVPIALFLIYLSLHYAVYYYILESDKLVKIYPGRIFNSLHEIKIKDIDHVEIRKLYAPASNIIFYINNKKDYMTYSYNDLATVIDYLIKHNVKIEVNVRRDFTKDLKIIATSLKQ